MISQRSCAQYDSGWKSCQTGRLFQPEVTIPSPQAVFASGVEDQQIKRLQDLVIGGCLFGLGVSAILTAVFDSKYHVDNHDHHHHDAHDHDHGDVNDAYDELVGRIMRQLGHGVEGICTTSAGLARIFGALFFSDRHYSKCKVISNVLQAFGAIGTITAAAGDLWHGHKSHAAGHFSQAGFALGMPLPELYFCMKKICTGEEVDIIQQENQRAICKKIAAASSILDALPAFYLAVSMESPFYAIETALNLLMGWGNAAFYRVRKNGTPFIRVEVSGNDSRDGRDRDSKKIVLIPQEQFDRIIEFCYSRGLVGQALRTNEGASEMVKSENELEDSVGNIEEVKKLIEQKTFNVLPPKDLSKQSHFLKV
ncbi:hypothetical protein GV64_21100 [Endozoicomonas elysicola]|uniref:Uncharacterized protein n=2 Tax=Endozoicomonas elysicola TaxID=305900 RepID=A0A081KFG1_9GAMM|nr:hypothetical protein GV64_21100 [Endozoicomonas elysicola]